MAGTIDKGMAPAPAPLMPPVHDGLAIASLICAFFIPPLGIVFGHMSHHVAKQAHRARSGIATAGLVLGYLFTAIGIIVVIVVGAAASSTPSVSAPPTARTYAPPTTAAPTTAAPSPSQSALTGPIGTTYTVTAGDGTAYTVTLDQVSQNINPGAYETPQNAGDHYAAAQFTITGTSGSTADDANSDAAAIGSDGQQYSYASIVSLPTFSYGEFHVSPGISVKGWVAFELPPGVTVASVQWAPSLTGSAATWTVGS